jgi:formylmethanofuran--tetrahydromethanopterin N-formyltransferase
VDENWARTAALEACGYASSIIACDAEAGIEMPVDAGATPDGRPGMAVLFFSFGAPALAQAVLNRIGQCVLTCPTTAVYDGFQTLPIEDRQGLEPETLPLGSRIRYFGDGFQKSKVIDGRRHWRIPVMDGEFLIDDSTWAAKGIAGGNFLICARTPPAGLEAARRAAAALAGCAGIITPFPGGIARSGSKVGSRYRALKASTNDAYCPTLRGRTRSALDPRINCVYEVIINGISKARISEAMKTGIHAACEAGGEDLIAISAGNYGGRLGKFHFPLHEVLR